MASHSMEFHSHQLLMTYASIKLAAFPQTLALWRQYITSTRARATSQMFLAKLSQPSSGKIKMVLKFYASNGPLSRKSSRFLTE